jgi:GNAT superfamily N-acetyltransferase
MEAQLCTLTDYFQILRDLPEFWGSDRTRDIHHPLFVREFGNSAFVIRSGTEVAAYLFGFLSQTEPVGYIHLIGVRSAHRRKGCGRTLYRRFGEFARQNGCRELKAITRAENALSIAFYRALGMELLGEPNAAGVPVVSDYSCPGEARVVFRMAIPAIVNESAVLNVRS